MLEAMLATDEQDADDEAITAPVWKNLLFLNDGRSVPGARTFATQEAAYAAAVAGEASIKQMLQANRNVVVICHRTGQRLYHISEYAYCIQVPWAAA